MWLLINYNDSERQRVLFLLVCHGSIILQQFGTMKNGKGKGQGPSSGYTAFRYKKIKEYVYDMQSILGKGNFSTVYRGRNQQRNEDVAVKVVKLSSLTFQKLEELLEQEIAISRALDHPNNIRCYEVLKSVNHCYFITELCEDGTLQKFIKKRGPMTQEEVWPYVRDIYEGLKYLHSKNIIHRDIKLANIFLKKGTAKLADFGFAVYAQELFKDINIGSPLYMSPEGYIDNVYGPKTDVWAFGLVVYELLHGKAPLSHIGTQEELKQLLRVPIKKEQFKADLSPEVKELITRCLEVDEKHRISMDEIENLAYFQNKMNTKFLSEVKMNSLRFRRLSVPNSMQYLRTPVKNLNQTLGGEKQNNISHHPQTEVHKFMTTKELPTPKRMLKVPSDEIEENTSIMLDYRDQDLIRTNVTFNQAIGLIHYCRIGFKLMQEKVSAELGRMLKSIVLKILEELKSRINSDLIVYTDEQNREKKESKLRLVVTQYLAKYGKEMEGERIHVVLPHLEDMLRKQLNESQKYLESKMQHSYLCMLFTNFTDCLVTAIKHKNYKLFGQNGVIDCCLQERNIPKNEEAYQSCKSKYESYHQPLVVN